MWWKIYFLYICVSQAGLLLVLPLAWYKYSTGDWFQLILNIFVGIALFSVAYGKKLFNKLYWKILFWIFIAELILVTLYQYTSFTALDFFFKPKHFIEDMSMYSFSLTTTIIITGVEVLLLLPTIYALYILAYKKIETKNIKKKAAKEAKKTKYSRSAIVSLVAGILGFLLGPVFTIIAFITGIMGLKKIQKSDYKLKGENLAWTGIILSLVQVFIITVFLFMLNLLIRPGLFDGYQSAVNHMDRQELQYYNSRVKHINSNSTPSEIAKFLGKPKKITKEPEHVSYVYNCPQSLYTNCVITIAMNDSKVKIISWWDPKRFFFIRNF